jgi:hypothetical protein
MALSTRYDQISRRSGEAVEFVRKLRKLGRRPNNRGLPNAYHEGGMVTLKRIAALRAGVPRKDWQT